MIPKHEKFKNHYPSNYQVDMSREKNVSYLTSATESTIIKVIMLFLTKKVTIIIVETPPVSVRNNNK